VPANFVGNDGNGRDTDPSDPGDWITASDKALYPDYCNDGAAGTSDSSWHGTHMTGVVAATANNAAGIAGVGWNLRVQPIRALGRCGGSLSDIADAVRWAAGAQPFDGRSWQQNGVTIGANPTPAKVINLSLGGGSTCGTEMQSAVDAAIAAGAVVVAATGNDGKVGLIAPANCNGVIAVTAHAINGENADYANIGPGTTLSAPGGGPPVALGIKDPINSPNFDGYYIHSTVLFGPTSPTSATASGSSGAAYAGFTGTSAATPHVAGVAALIRSLAPSLTPAQVRSILSTAGNLRPYPAGSACAAGGLLAGQCGAGLLDADKALTAVGPEATPAAAAGSDQIVAPGTAVTLSGTASKAFFGKAITAYQWTQTAGTPTVTLTTPAAATTSFAAPATGTLTFRLRVTDDAGKVGDDFVNVRVNSAPVLAAAPAAPTAAAGSVVSFAVAATDVDGDPLTFTAAAGSTVPFLALSPSGQFSWNTTGFGAGTYQLVYFATDGTAQSSTQTVTITLTGGSSANAPSGGGGGGGGGALPWLQLLLVGSLLAARRSRQSVGQREG
jgi:serine protease